MRRFLTGAILVSLGVTSLLCAASVLPAARTASAEVLLQPSQRPPLNTPTGLPVTQPPQPTSAPPGGSSPTVTFVLPTSTLARPRATRTATAPATSTATATAVPLTFTSTADASATALVDSYTATAAALPDSIEATAHAMAVLTVEARPSLAPATVIVTVAVPVPQAAGEVENLDWLIWFILIVPIVIVLITLVWLSRRGVLLPALQRVNGPRGGPRPRG